MLQYFVKTLWQPKCNIMATLLHYFDSLNSTHHVFWVVVMICEWQIDSTDRRYMGNSKSTWPSDIVYWGFSHSCKMFTIFAVIFQQ